jgi:hypothetical protein
MVLSWQIDKDFVVHMHVPLIEPSCTSVGMRLEDHNQNVSMLASACTYIPREISASVHNIHA